MAKAMNITELRFGGNFSSYYHWRDGVGPADQRLTMENIAWGIPEYNDFGTDEFLQLCDLLGVVPQFDLNMGSGTPEEAVQGPMAGLLDSGFKVSVRMVADHMGFRIDPNIRTIQDIAVATADIDYDPFPIRA